MQTPSAGRWINKRPLHATSSAPFRWNAQGLHNRVDVCFLWTWQGAAGRRRNSFVFTWVMNVSARQVPRPPGLDEEDEDTHKRLVGAASLETKQRKAPCKYLGVQTSKGEFEADPAKWPSRNYPGEKTQATVYFNGTMFSARRHHTVGPSMLATCCTTTAQCLANI